MKIILIILGWILLNTQLNAETLKVEYTSFYSHVKKLDDTNINALRFAFGFKHISEPRLCNVKSAQIVTQKQNLSLTVEDNFRFTVPTNKILKMAKALVVIELDDQANQCDMSVQLETLPRFLKTQYSQTELLELFNQYQAFFEKMGGFLSFMMPVANGLQFHFNDNQVLPTNLQDLTERKGVIGLSQDWLLQHQSLKLPTSPLRITAMIEK